MQALGQKYAGNKVAQCCAVCDTVRDRIHTQLATLNVIMTLVGHWVIIIIIIIIINLFSKAGYKKGSTRLMWTY